MAVFRERSTTDGGGYIGRCERYDGCRVLRNPPPDAEFGRPQWVFGTATWVFVGPSRMLAAYTQRGRWFLADVDTDDRRVAQRRHRSRAARLDGGRREAAPTRVRDSGGSVRDRADCGRAPRSVVRARRGAPRVLDARARIGTTSPVPQPIRVPNRDGGDRARDLLRARRIAARRRRRDDERPPLIAISHGGPTTATNATLDLKVQFWTSRGFAVVDVNYRGSSGFGRAYRNGCAAQWGIADVADMVHAARHLVAAGLADESRLDHPRRQRRRLHHAGRADVSPGVFKAGASYYGISDIEVLARDTHKFEARYLDRLVGPYPEARDGIARARRFISSIAGVPASSCSRGSRTASCRRISPR